MLLEDIANPLLSLPEMRTSGIALLPHGGTQPSLGAGQQVGWSIISPVEFIFRETSDGTSARGSQSLAAFYQVRQNVTQTKIWSSIDGQSWLAPWKTGLESDPIIDPALSLNTQDSPQPLISFYDSPGFQDPPQSTKGVSPQAIKVFLFQGFQVWCEINQSFSSGVFQASPAKSWSNLICVQRDDPTSNQWRVSSAALVSGKGQVDRPLCD